MSAEATELPNRLGTAEQARALVDAWVESLAQVLESMADERPEFRWEPASEPAIPEADGAERELLWWEQPFEGAAEAKAWVGAPRSAWEYAGGQTLRAAGLETVDTAEARNTWLEILSQSLSVMARTAGSLLGHEVVCAGGGERPPGPEVVDFARVWLKFKAAAPAPFTLALNPRMLDLLSAPAGAHAEPRGERAGEGQPPEPPKGNSQTLALLLDVELPVSISFGRKEIAMKDVLKLTTGSIIELDRDVNEPVEVLVNHCLIARGEVVVVDGNYGVRIQQIANRHERLRSVR
jgi:flagellar motor switch protein FliN/FliY